MSEQKNNHSTENKAPPPDTPAVNGQQGYYDASYNYGPPVPTGYPLTMHPPMMHPPGFQPEPCWPNPGLVPTVPPPAMAYPPPYSLFPEPQNIMSQQPVPIAQDQHPVPMEEPKDYLAWSIFSLLCCSLVCGIPAVIFSCLVKENPEAPTSASYSKMALVFNVISLITGMIIWGVSIGIVVQAINQPGY